MQLKIILKWPLFIFSIVGIAISAITILFLIPDLYDQGSYAKSIFSVSSQIPQNLLDNESARSVQSVTSEEQINSSLPIRLKIPKIDVDVALEYVGLTSQGAVDVPKVPANAAWFDLGPQPGDNGSAVITGHYGRWKNGEESVFENLNKLRKGDIIFIEDEKGGIISFVVRESRSYDPNADVPEVFASSDGKAHLNLITCEGVWNKVSKSYSKRLVVFADRE